VASGESMAAEIYKKRVLESDSTATTLTDTISGLWARALRNRFTEEYRASGAPVLPPHVQRVAAGDVYQASLKNQDPDYYPMMTGQSTGLIHDLPGAAEVVGTIVREAQAVLERLRRGHPLVSPPPPSPPPAPKRVPASARKVEAPGFACLWTAETQHDPFLPLAIAATATTRLKLGTAIAVAFPRSPMITAHIAWD